MTNNNTASRVHWLTYGPTRYRPIFAVASNSNRAVYSHLLDYFYYFVEALGASLAIEQPGPKKPRQHRFGRQVSQNGIHARMFANHDADALFTEFEQLAYRRP